MLRWRRRNYDAKLAPRMWRYTVDAAAKEYAREVEPDKRWDLVLSPATRDIVAAEMTQDFERLAAAGSFDGLVARRHLPKPRAVAPSSPLVALLPAPAPVEPPAPGVPLKMPEPEFLVRRRAARLAAEAQAAPAPAISALFSGPTGQTEQAPVVEVLAAAPGAVRRRKVP